MPRSLSHRDNQRRAKGRRDSALQRMEMERPTEARQAASGITSPAIKAEDPALRAMIDAALAKRGQE